MGKAINGLVSFMPISEKGSSNKKILPQIVLENGNNVQITAYPNPQQQGEELAYAVVVEFKNGEQCDFNLQQNLLQIPKRNDGKEELSEKDKKIAFIAFKLNLKEAQNTVADEMKKLILPYEKSKITTDERVKKMDILQRQLKLLGQAIDRLSEKTMIRFK